MTELVAAALEDPHPRPKQIVGGSARELYALGRLPERVQDRLIGLLIDRTAKRTAADRIDPEEALPARTISPPRPPRARATTSD